MLKRAMAATAVLMLASSIAHAASKYYLQSGDCQPGTPQAAWWCVIEIDGQGRPIRDWGVDCQGNWYYHTFDIHPVSSDPTNGASATITDRGENGVTWSFV